MGEVWTTYSEISGWPFIVFFGADFGNMDSVYLTPDDVNWPGQVKVNILQLNLFIFPF